MKWSVVKCSEMKWSEVKWSEVKWSEVKGSEVSYGEVLGTKLPCTLWWPYTDGTWLYCDYIIWCVSCTVVVWTGFVMCGCVCGVCVRFVMCGFFGNMCTCIYCFVLLVLCFCIVSFMYICSYLFCLYWCEDCWQRVTTELQLVVIIIIIIIIIK